MSAFEATPVVHFGQLVPANTKVLAVGLGWDGSVLLVSRSSQEALRTVRPGGASFAKSHHDEPTDLHITRWAEGQVRRMVCRDQRLIPHCIQPLGDDVLLASARCRWRKEGPERNGLVCSWSGDVVRKMVLGDGIAHLRTTPDGMIWVSFFDEGVFGNYGWGGPGPAPIGGCGLVRFDAQGQQNLRYDAEQAETDMICDAYATNVDAAGNAWVTFYTEFPLVRMTPEGTYSQWPIGQRGASGVAIEADRVLMAGGDDARDQVVVMQLGPPGSCKRLRKGTIVSSSGTALRRAEFVGVGSSLYAIQDETLYVLDSW